MTQIWGESEHKMEGYEKYLYYWWNCYSLSMAEELTKLWSFGKKEMKNTDPEIPLCFLPFIHQNIRIVNIRRSIRAKDSSKCWRQYTALHLWMDWIEANWKQGWENNLLYLCLNYHATILYTFPMLYLIRHGVCYDIHLWIEHAIITRVVLVFVCDVFECGCMYYPTTCWYTLNVCNATIRKSDTQI